MFSQTMRFAFRFLFVCAAFAFVGRAHAEVPRGFVPLFNGKDLSGWKGLIDPRKRASLTPEELKEAQVQADRRMREHWHVENGELVFDGEGDSLCTEKDYADFELLVDWRIESGGDSGIYLRGVPQVQIWDTEHKPYFQYGSRKGSGALWNNQIHARFPLEKADKPVGQWNTFLIRMVGDRVSTNLNGKLVVDDVVLENYWERESPVPDKGSIELQSHKTKLWFRNLYIRELKHE